MIRFICIVASVSAALACAHAPFEAPARVTVQAPSSAYERALRAIVMAGFDIGAMDERAGFLQGAWRETRRDAFATGIVTDRERAVVTIADGVATVWIEQQRCTRASTLDVGVGVCERAARAADDVARVEAIAQGIATGVSG